MFDGKDRDRNEKHRVRYWDLLKTFELTIIKVHQFDLSRNLNKVGIRALEESLRIGTELIVEMELVLVRDVAQFCLQSAMKCRGKANHFINKVCEDFLIDPGEQGPNAVHWNNMKTP